MSLAMEEKILNIENNVIDIKEVQPRPFHLISLSLPCAPSLSPARTHACLHTHNASLLVRTLALTSPYLTFSRFGSQMSRR